MRRVIIKNGKVINIIKDHVGVEYPFPVDEILCIDEDVFVGIGFEYVNGTFIDPYIPPIDDEFSDDEIDQWINEE